MCQKFMIICSKHLLIILNILFFVLGLGVLVLGTWFSVDKTSLFDLVSNSTSGENTTKDETIVKSEIHGIMFAKKKISFYQIE